jgi:hypothetical protein
MEKQGCHVTLSKTVYIQWRKNLKYAEFFQTERQINSCHISYIFLQQIETGLNNVPLHFFISGVSKRLAGREFE